MISAIVLAAGTSSRMGRAKALEPLAGRSLLHHVLRNLEASQVGEIVVVLGHEADRVRRETPLADATVVVNPDYALGMSTSLRAGLRAIHSSAEAFFAVLADQPLVSPATLDVLIARREESNARILIPTYTGIRGNPVLLDHSLSGEVEAITGDQGCRAIFGDYADDILEVPVDDPGVLLDVDTPEQLARIESAIRDGETLADLVQEFMQPHHHRPTALRERSGMRPRTDVAALGEELRRRGEPFVTAVVVRTVRPTSGKPGYRAIIRADREVTGWLGGSCVESAVLTESMAALRDGRPRVVRLTREAGLRPPEEGVVEYVMECHSGGAMDIYLEPHVPKPKLLVVGDSPIAEALTSLGRLLSYHVVAVAPRAGPEEFPDADEVISDLGRLAELATSETYAVVATMGKYDASAVRGLATSRAVYVGLVASRKRAGALLAELRGEGVPSAALERVRSPAGLDVAAQTPEEIALSILAEITRTRRASSPVRDLPIVEPGPAGAVPIAIDPVCHMEVRIDTPLRATDRDTTYYFCSESCRTRFLESPEAFLE